MESLLAAAATVIGVAMAVSPVLQIRRIRAERSALGVSTLQIAILVAGFAVWFAYGVAAAIWPLIITNAVAVVAHVGWFAAAAAHRREPSP